jgi:hypothetical protein
MIRVVLIWLLQALCLAGVGRLAQQWWWRQQRLGLAETVWLGLALVVVFAQVWHFFLPINSICTCLIITVSLPGIALLWKQRQDLSPPRSNLVFWSVILLLIAMLAASHVAVKGIIVGDTRLYHLNVIRWTNEFSIVPGLANLHQRFGVNSTWLLYASLLDVGWAEGRSAWLVSGLPIFLILAQWLAVFFIHEGPSHTPSKIYCLVTLPYLLELIEGLRPSLYYDKPPLILLLVLGLHLIRAPWLQRVSRSTYDWQPSAIWCLTASALAFSFKASTAPALIFVSTVIVWHWIHIRGKVSTLAVIWLLPTLIVALYMLTNIVVSGWPLFPIPALGAPVSWAQPRENVAAFHRLIADWAPLQSREGLEIVRQGFWNWWQPWLHAFAKTPEHFITLLCTIISTCIAWRFTSQVPHRYPWRVSSVLVLLAMGAGGILFWFLTAPDLRFGDGLFFFWLGLCATFAAPLFSSRPRLQTLAAATLCLTLLAWVKPLLLPWVEFSAIKVSKARSDEVIARQLPGTPKIWTPVEPTEDMLGDSPLPSAPSLNPDLRLRDPENLGSGFYLSTSGDLSPSPQ